MCGIAGIVDVGGLGNDAQTVIGRMVQVLRHRGPDDAGCHIERLAGLGHARLSIIDLASGRQPIANEDETVWITFNGEIYNFPELREELLAKGHQFRTHTDTETIVHLYEEEGERCVERLRGMFAFGIWDRNRERLLLARDRLGIKPLYYALRGKQLAFGSEIKALLEVPDCPREIDPEAMQDFLTFGWIPAPKSIFRGIRKLPPAHTATFDASGLRLREYWDLDDSDELALSEEELQQQLCERLTEAVRVRLVSDVPLGAFLSGGVDSSSVVATMAGLCSEPVITNSIGFDERRFNEIDHADRVAALFHTEHHRQIVRPDAADILSTLAWHWDEPFADSSAVPTYYLSKMAREQVTVALSGDGGDENLAGYRKYKFSHRQRLARRFLPAAVRRGLVRPLAAAYPQADWLPRVFRAKSTLRELAGSDVEAMYRARAVLPPEVAQSLLHTDMRSALEGYDSLSVIEHHYRRCPMRDPLHRELYVDIKTYLVDDILTKVDRASMAVGLEVRVPLLDHQLVEFMARIPARYKLRNGQGKYLLKRAFRPILGTEIVDRPKMGFSVPLNAWLRGPLRPIVEGSIFSPNAKIREWLDMDHLRMRWRGLLSGIEHCEPLVWSVLMLEQWAQQFCCSAPPVQPTHGPTLTKPDTPQATLSET